MGYFMEILGDSTVRNCNRILHKWLAVIARILIHQPFFCAHAHYHPNPQANKINICTEVYYVMHYVIYLILETRTNKQ